jgi:hypothetical protein
VLLTVTFRIPPKIAQAFGGENLDDNEPTRARLEKRIREIVAAAGLTFPPSPEVAAERGEP